MPRAILSVSDKSQLTEFAKELSKLGWDLIASGGTARTLRAAGLAVTPVDIVTGAPEMLGGRVKTLHPAIHAGILARDIASDIADLEAQGYAPISMVVCNLYPFQATVAKPDVTLDQAIEQIDIGGVTLLRAAAKNFARVTVVSDPADYAPIVEQIQANGNIPLEQRQALAIKAFAQTRDYDTAIHGYLQEQSSAFMPKASTKELPHSVPISLVKASDLRYGENPHQAAAFYAPTPSASPLGGIQLAGPPYKYNTLLDLDAGWTAANEYSDPTVVLIKHQIPVGICTASTLARAFPLALATDRHAAIGCSIAVNRTVNDDFVMELGDLFIEAIVAPDFTDGAIANLKNSRKNCGLLKVSGKAAAPELQLRSIRGGMLGQYRDEGEPAGMGWRTVTRWKASPEETELLHFAWQCAKHVPSNSIVVAAQSKTIGIGSGQPDQLDAARLALQKAGTKARGAVLASDASFSSIEIIEMAAKAGITAIVQTGGDLRDAKLIAAADDAGIAMVFTGIRHVRH